MEDFSLSSLQPVFLLSLFHVPRQEPAMLHLCLCQEGLTLERKGKGHQSPFFGTSAALGGAHACFGSGIDSFPSRGRATPTDFCPKVMKTDLAAPAPNQLFFQRCWGHISLWDKGRELQQRLPLASAGAHTGTFIDALLSSRV